MKTVLTSVRIPEELLKMLKDEAKQENRSANNLLVTIVRDWMAEKEKAA